ncbi:MAG TPA: HD domain-containing protein [Acholeplasma sp.]|nr:HD domain-containing protein [Acholeplasma sp.]
MKINDAKNIVKKKLNNHPNRYNHIIRVYEMAVKLAEHYNADVYKVSLAAIFHDYSKYDTILEQTKYLSKDEVLLYEDTKVMYHSLSAAYVLKNEFNINDCEILNAIKYHVWGHPKMTLIDKIVLISDKIELGRNYPLVEELRKLAFKDINLAIYKFLEDNITYNLNKGFKIHKSQYETIESLKEEMHENT